MTMTHRKILRLIPLSLILLALQGCSSEDAADLASIKGCLAALAPGGAPSSTPTRADRFQGKVEEALARCRGGENAVRALALPWVDWGNYYGTGDTSSLASGAIATAGPLGPTARGVTGALIDMERERIELLKYNLFENNGSYRDYVLGRNGAPGPSLKTWDVMRLPKDNPNYAAVGGDNPSQECKGSLIRGRTLTGICNDILNPAMGSSGQLFARNVEFEATFPELSQDVLTRNRHGNRLGLLQPDPQLISRRLFTREGHDDPLCKEGFGTGDRATSRCAYQPAPFFNVIAAYWIQFMTHDWFSHLEEGQNDTSTWMPVGCSPADAQRYGCRPGDRMDRGLVADKDAPGKFSANGTQYLLRAPKTMRNTNTAWWDASQIYGFDEISLKRVKRDPADRARLLMSPLPNAQDRGGYLPLLQPGDPMQPGWAGQEATAFPDNWTVGLSFLTNLFVREHNSFVAAFRQQAAKTPAKDSGLRNPDSPAAPIPYGKVTDDELYTAARLVVSAEIAKIHTVEWTPQLLYDEPLFKAMNANWNGLVGPGHPGLTKILQNVVAEVFGKSKDPNFAVQWYSAFASGAGIVGTGSQTHNWKMNDAASTNGGVNHFGSPFNFPEEFISVYRLHPLVPDLIEFRDLKKDPNRIVARVPVVETFQSKATDAMHAGEMPNWALSMGRQRLGLLTLHNHPAFLQNLTIGRLQSDTGKIDVAALDIIRDREHGIPRFNEFRRQYGLRSLTSFDDFIDKSLPAGSPERTLQESTVRKESTVRTLREIYGQHVCDASKVITDAQRFDPRNPAQKGADVPMVNDCLGHDNGTLVDNIEDVDTTVGYLAEPRRPHGFAISETQFVVFILNASRRLFSDRFLTSSYRPEFYTTMGLNWVNNNGPGDPQYEPGEQNTHPNQPVSPLKRLLLRNIPELKDELSGVINAFDPWNRKRGPYYDLSWKPRAGAESDDAFSVK